MKKLVASLTLLVALASLAGAKGFLDDVGSAFGRGADRLFGSMSTPLKGKEYDTVLAQYLNEPEDDWDNHNFKKYGEMQLSYCKRGLPEACGDYGGDFMVGLYTQRNFNDAKKYLQYAIKNTKHEWFLEYYETALYIADDLKKYSDESIIGTIKAKFNAYASDCINGRGVKDTCMIAFAYITLIPKDMLGLTDKEYEEILKKLYLSDIERNGEAESKIFKFLADFFKIKELSKKLSQNQMDEVNALLGSIGSKHESKK